MKVQDRPYAGNWSEDFVNKYRTTRSWTPDAIVTFNGETTLPGCPTCNNKIDFSRFINSVNVGGGVDGSNSCDISLKIPWAYGDSVYKDGRFVLTTGIEVFVYYRGFFQVKELALQADNIDLESGEVLSAPDAETRPYYPVFHGVISSVSVDLSDGAYSVSIGTRNMLSFWDNQQINTQQGYFAADPTMSRGSVNLRGHVYTNMTPHQIIYDLFLDTGGAAEGTGFALRKSSNVTARNSTGQQNYSLMLRYLEQRFKNGMYGLRMYGASGRMYSAIETQIIANQAVTTNEKEAEFRSVIKKQNKPYAKPKSNEISFSRMVKAGLVAYEGGAGNDGRLQRAVDGRYLTKLSEKDDVGLSVLSLKPFVTDLGSFGSVAFFESSLESKKSIAQRVCEVTGYEFYQDMDGDLVFKPPMYNMDTSTDRVYNIFREDTISISYSHAEPEATYVTMKGSHFRNFDGAAPTGEWGVKGVYVDYALVAKYGWKGQDFDSSFYNSPRQAYYAAAVELDKQNKNTEGCDITIPLRPEIKPGYPVYVEENDCYYYVESVSHSFSYGGSCTTSLTLVCQRKKFIPPGLRKVKYRDDPARAVDLGRTELPEKFIYKRYDRTDEGNSLINIQSGEVLEGDKAYRKITGFPNVVMAFDHDNINPSMLYYEPDFQRVGKAGTKERERYRNMIINEGIRLGVLFTEPGVDIRKGPWYLLVPSGDGGSPRKVSLGVDSNGEIAGLNALDTFSRKSFADGEKAAKLIGKGGKATKVEKYQAAEDKRLANLQGNLQAAVGSAGVYSSTAENNPTGQESEATILDLIYLIRSAFGRGESTSPLQNLMSALQDRKSSFAPKAQGYFRYYSSSHPSPEHQGPDLTSYNIDPESDIPTLIYNDNVPDEVRDNVVLADPMGDGDTVIFGNNSSSRSRIVRGLMTRTMYSSGIEYVPTKDILALSFQVRSEYTVQKVDGPKVEVDQNWYQMNTAPGVDYWVRTLDIIKGEVVSSIFSKKGKAFFSYNISKLFEPFDKDFSDLPLEVSLPKTFKNMPPNRWAFEDASSYFSSDNYKVTAASVETIGELGITSGGVAIKSKKILILHFAQALTYTLWAKTKELYPDVYDQELWSYFLRESKVDLEAVDDLLELEGKVQNVRAFLSQCFGQRYDPNANTKLSLVRDKITIKGKKSVTTPIFPISDAKGYEVFGAYQYGRGLKPSRGTLFDALLKQDPTQALTPDQLKEAINVLDQSKSQTEYREGLKQLYLERIRDLDPTERDRLTAGLGLSAELTGDEDLSVVENALANRLMTRTDEQIITNIPATLSEIYPSTEGNEVCECRIHNTDALLLEGGLNLDSFLEIENPMLRSVRNETERKAVEWREHQSTLRGENIPRPRPDNTNGGFATTDANGDFNNRGTNRLINAVTNAGEAFEVAVSNIENTADEFTDQQRAIKAAQERIGGDN